jgi:hypothetical protein
MRVAATLGIALVMGSIHALHVVGSAQTAPVVLSADDIGDTYDKAPELLRAAKTWVGLFIVNDKGGGEEIPSKIATARVRFIHTAEANGGQKIAITPPGATLLVSGVRSIRQGPAITAAQAVELRHEEPEARVTFRERLYSIRLASDDPAYCDAVISLTSDAVTQKLFDAKSPGLQWSCDEPHFKIHWAGDLDRDGHLDMLVTFSEKYSYYPRQLLLSSAARAPNLVTEVARYDRFSE